ncbi:MAG: DUF2330 domain-containing protein, partial [Burkholderiaceae bacterium]|nr:DUF2330 domain-containing protein [Burkholderiaceae bacterium]
MRAASTTIAVFAALLSLSAPHPAAADPCGMVPPVVQGLQDPIVRVGPQRTYVFYRKGIETFVIRPGFRGKVEEFGMLIPFPTPPAIRKVPDNIFAHIASAIDPPEVQVWVRGYRGLLADSVKSAAEKAPSGGAGLQLARNQVRVLRREAVGMYEVAVLAAGSAQALSRWMDQHKFKYPKGMDQPVNDYVKAGWCFVAVKTRVGAKGKVNPRPGMRNARTSLPPSGFTGHVQGMGFRFKTDGLVVPMRLSAFNKGRLRNVVYILSTGPKRIKKIPQKYVMRQLPGWKLYRNLTRPLPLRVFGGTFKELNKWQRQSLGRRRNPVPHNGLAAELFASDLLAARSGRLSHPFEEREKSLLNIGEELGLRGAAIDALNAQVLGKARKKAVNRALRFVKQMSLSVVDGDFARDVLSQDNLRFAWFRMPRERNNPASYNARMLGPDRSRRGGTLYRGSLDSIIDRMRQRAEAPRQRPTGGGGGTLLGVGLGVLVAGLFALALVRRRG